MSVAKSGNPWVRAAFSRRRGAPNSSAGYHFAGQGAQFKGCNWSCVFFRGRDAYPGSQKEDTRDFVIRPPLHALIRLAPRISLQPEPNYSLVSQGAFSAPQTIQGWEHLLESSGRRACRLNSSPTPTFPLLPGRDRSTIVGRCSVRACYLGHANYNGRGRAVSQARTAHVTFENPRVVP